MTSQMSEMLVFSERNRGIGKKRSVLTLIAAALIQQRCEHLHVQATELFVACAETTEAHRQRRQSTPLLLARRVRPLRC